MGSYDKRSIHFSKSEVWHYKPGYRYVKIWKPGQNSQPSCVIPILELTGRYSSYASPLRVKFYIFRCLRFQAHPLIPEASRVDPFRLKCAILAFFDSISHEFMSWDYAAGLCTNRNLS